MRTRSHSNHQCRPRRNLPRTASSQNLEPLHTWRNIPPEDTPGAITDEERGEARSMLREIERPVIHDAEGTSQTLRVVGVRFGRVTAGVIGRVPRVTSQETYGCI